MVTRRPALSRRKSEPGASGLLRGLLPDLLNPRHVDIGDEVVGIGTFEHENLNPVVSLGLLNEASQIAD
jgi:hypothetical protein